MSKGNNRPDNNNNQQGYSDKTRGGLTPDYSRGLDFKIDSEAIRKYINDMVDTVIAEYNKKAREASEPQINNTGEARIMQIMVSEIYQPVMLFIPDQWVITTESLQKPNENALFYQDREEDNAKSVALYPCIKNVLGQFVYTKADIRAFYADTWKKEHGVSSVAPATLKSYVVPKRYKFGDDESYGPKSAVMVLIDPIRILHSMAASPQDNGKRYVINNLRTKSHGKGKWGYTFTKLYVTNKFKKDKLNQRIRSHLQNQFTFGGSRNENNNHKRHKNNNNFRYNNSNQDNDGKKKKKRKKNSYYSNRY